MVRSVAAGPYVQGLMCGTLVLLLPPLGSVRWWWLAMEVLHFVWPFVKARNGRHFNTIDHVQIHVRLADHGFEHCSMNSKIN